MVPHGFRFNPTDEELVEMLHQKATESGNINIAEAPSLGLIVERNVYELEPQPLEWKPTVALNYNESFYYCKRESDSREVLGRGWWKATSHVKTIFANGKVVGSKRPLTYHRFRDNCERKRKDAIKTDWIMHEYGLHSIPTEWRLCKIKNKGKKMVTAENMEKTRYPVNRAAAAATASSTSSSSIGSITPMQQAPPLPNDDGDSFLSNMMTPHDQMIHQEQQQQMLPPSSFSLDPTPNQDTEDFTFTDLWSSNLGNYWF